VLCSPHEGIGEESRGTPFGTRERSLWRYGNVVPAEPKRVANNRGLKTTQQIRLVCLPSAMDRFMKYDVVAA
jgi:hypothetical protein